METLEADSIQMGEKEDLHLFFGFPSLTPTLLRHEYDCMDARVVASVSDHAGG